MNLTALMVEAENLQDIITRNDRGNRGEVSMEPEQSKEIVAIVKHDGSSNSLRKVLELCNGLDGLKANDKVLLKPNVLWGGTRGGPLEARLYVFACLAVRRAPD